MPTAPQSCWHSHPLVLQVIHYNCFKKHPTKTTKRQNAHHYSQSMKLRARPLDSSYVSSDGGGKKNSQSLVFFIQSEELEPYTTLNIFGDIKVYCGNMGKHMYTFYQ